MGPAPSLARSSCRGFALLLLTATLGACAPAAAPSPTAAPAAPVAPTVAAAKPAATAAAKPAIKIITGNVTFPSLLAPGVAIINAKNLAKKNGLDLEIKAFSQIPASQASIQTGEVNVHITGAHLLQRMRNEGVPVQAISTYARLDALQVLTANPNIKELKDLKGKKLAADMASSEYQVLAVYAKSKGLDLKTDVTVAQAGLPIARQQLKTGEADAAMLWEPTVSQAIQEDNKNYRSIFEGEKAWQEMTSTEGWELVYVAREDWARANPEAITRWIATLKDMEQFIKESLDEADAIVAKDVQIPAGVFKESVRSGRMVYSIAPAWEEKPRKALEQMFKLAVDVGYLNKLPPAEVFYKP